MITQEDAQNKVARKKSHDGGQTDRHSTGCHKIKRACAKEAPGTSPQYSKRQVHKKFQEEVQDVTRAGTEELKMHDRGQIDRYSTGCPKMKWACAKRL